VKTLIFSNIGIFVVLLAAGCWGQRAVSFGAPEHSKVKVSTEIQGTLLNFRFKIILEKDKKINFEGPFTLKLVPSKL